MASLGSSAATGGLSKSQKKKLKKKRAADQANLEALSLEPAVVDADASLEKDGDAAVSAAASGAAAASGSDLAFTMEEEVLWCVQQLQLGLKRLKSSKRAEAADALKLINTLQSAKTPLPRKRQLMRGHFGDYRAKMRAAFKAQKSAPTREVSLKAVKEESLSTGTFFRRSRHAAGSQAPGAATAESAEEPFKFNFAAP